MIHKIYTSQENEIQLIELLRALKVKWRWWPSGQSPTRFEFDTTDEELVMIKLCIPCSESKTDFPA